MSRRCAVSGVPRLTHSSRQWTAARRVTVKDEALTGGVQVWSVLFMRPNITNLSLPRGALQYGQHASSLMFSDPGFRSYSPSPKYLISLFSPQPPLDPWKFTCDPSVVALIYINQGEYGPKFDAILSQDYPSDNTHPHWYRLLLVLFSSS